MACYPDKAMKDVRKKYFQDAKMKYDGEDISEIEDKAFQEELLNTLKLLFEDEFKEYL